jgi:hypothetical protein
MVAIQISVAVAEADALADRLRDYIRHFAALVEDEGVDLIHIDEVSRALDAYDAVRDWASTHNPKLFRAAGLLHATAATCSNPRTSDGRCEVQRANLRQSLVAFEAANDVRQLMAA